MATKGEVSVTVTSWDTLKFSWWFNSGDQSVENNSTLVRWKMELIAGSSGQISSTAQKDWSVTVNDTPYSGKNTVGISNNSTKTLASGTTTVQHEDDGSKVFFFSFSQQFDVDFNGRIGTKSGTGNGVLNTIARASQPSCITWPEHTQNVGEFGDTISIHMNRKSSSFTHTVRYKFGSSSGTIAQNVTTGTTWTIPLSLMNLIPDGSKGSGTIYVDTYNGTTKIGTKWCGYTATVPASVRPTCSLQVLDATDIQATYGNLVKGLSKLYIKVTGAGVYSSKIVDYGATVKYDNGQSVVYNGDSEITTGFLGYAGTVTVEANVTDSRGDTSVTRSASFPVIDYNKPKISSLAVHRCNEDGTENENGEYVKVTFSAVITPLNNNNSATYTLRYINNTTGNVTVVPLTDINNTYTVNGYSKIFAADSGSSYTVEIDAEDNFNNIPLGTAVSTAFTLYNCHKSGTGWAFGKVAEKEYTLENALSLNQMGNRYTLSSAGTAGTAGYVLMAEIEVTAANADTPITFVLSRRQAESTMTVHVQLRNSSGVNATVRSVRYEGANYDAYIASQNGTTTSNIWRLYVAKGSAYDTVTIQDWYTSRTMESRVSITFPSGNLASAVPTPFYKATPAKTQSILDFVYPVGSIYLAFNHTSPATLFGGTWVRIENAFLWACDADGEIGVTGGSKTHKLTVAELPSHTHNISVANTATGSVAASNKVRFNNNASSFVGNIATESVGSGVEHNNMPPYIHISAWRRTA